MEWQAIVSAWEWVTLAVGRLTTIRGRGPRRRQPRRHLLRLQRRIRTPIQVLPQARMAFVFWSKLPLAQQMLNWLICAAPRLADTEVGLTNSSMRRYRIIRRCNCIRLTTP